MNDQRERPSTDASTTSETRPCSVDGCDRPGIVRRPLRQEGTVVFGLVCTAHVISSSTRR